MRLILASFALLVLAIRADRRFALNDDAAGNTGTRQDYAAGDLGDGTLSSPVIDTPPEAPNTLH